jgi:NADP-dependent 3-hydroxy acid dehydrogenase YdfG
LEAISHAIKANSADPSAVQRTVAQAVEMFRRLDIVEMNAGILLLGSIETVSLGDMNRMLTSTSGSEAGDEFSMIKPEW